MRTVEQHHSNELSQAQLAEIVIKQNQKSSNTVLKTNKDALLGILSEIKMIEILTIEEIL